MQGYKAAAMSGANGSNGSKKPAPKKKPAASDKGNGKPNGSDAADHGAPTTRAPPPGFAPAAKPNAWGPAPVGFSDSQQRLLRHRALFVFRFLVGKAVEVTLVDASRYVGILDCIDPDDFSIVLKNTQRKSAEAGETEFDSGSTVIFKRRQLAHIAADGVVNYSDGASGLNPASAASVLGFRTDTEISNRSHDHLYGRELESAASWLDPQLDTGDLEDTRRRKTAWNQFEANEKLFGVVSSYDENLYTTKLDKSKISNEKSREAERLAREIERETTGNFHLQEERGQAVYGDDDLDEEAKYSSVDRKQSAPVPRNPNAYVPPALRNSSRPSSAGPTKSKPVTPEASTSPKPEASTTPPPLPSSKSQVASTTVSAPVPIKSTPVSSTSPSTAAAPSTPSVDPPSSTAAPATTPTTDTQPRKPISFSEAVTGRPAARSSLAPDASAVAPTSVSGKASSKQEQKPSTPKKESSPKSNVSVAAKSASPASSKKEVKTQAAKTDTDKKPASTPADKKPSAESKAEKKPKSTKPSSDSSPKSPAAEPAPAVTESSSSGANSTSATPAKKTTTLNPKAKEFKLSASAAAFTPKFSTPAATPTTASPYRQPAAAHYGHAHPPPPHPAMAGMGYAPAPEEWMYDGMMLDDGEYAAAAAHAYMGYGMPMIPNPAMMQQPMYAPMMPPQQNVRMGRTHGGAAGGYGYNQPGMYNPRGYYGQGAVPGVMPFHPAPGSVPGIPQPPLPPTPADASGDDVPSTPSAAPIAAESQRSASSSKHTEASSKK